MVNTIHVLMHGDALCGMPGVPRDWPPEHLWVSFEDESNAGAVNCPSCLEVREYIRTGVPPPKKDPPPLGRPSDRVLAGLLQVYQLAEKTGGTVSELPPGAVLRLIEEIVEARALAEGSMEEILLEGAKNDGFACNDRPTDEALREMTATWRSIVTKCGPSYQLQMPALALLTLGEEIIECRKAPRA